MKAHLVPAEDCCATAPFRNRAGAVVPTFTMAVAREHKGRPTRVAVVVARLDRLLHLSRESQVFDIRLVGADGVLLAHRDAARVGKRERVAQPQTVSRGVRAEARTYTSDGVEVIGGVRLDPDRRPGAGAPRSPSGGVLLPRAPCSDGSPESRWRC